MSLNLKSVEAKLARVEEHRLVLDREIRAWFDSHPFETVFQASEDLKRYSWVVRIKADPEVVRWSLVIGDAIHNLRSALDHLIYAIAEHELEAPKFAKARASRKLAFVVRATPAEFQKTLAKLSKDGVGIGTLSSSVQTAIEQVQPYHRPHTLIPPPISVLSDLDNEDKHNLLSVVFCAPLTGRITNPHNVPPDAVTRFTNEPLEDGMRIVWMDLKQPTPDVSYGIEVALALVARHSPGPTGVGLSAPVVLLDYLLAEARHVIAHVVAAVPDKTRLITDVVTARADSHNAIIDTNDPVILRDTLLFLRNLSTGRRESRKFWMVSTPAGRVLAQQVGWRVEIDRVACRDVLGEDV